MSSWARTLDVSDVFRGEAPFPERRDIMAARVRALAPDDDDLQDIADQLGYSADEDEWDEWWDQFYDWADRNRVWVETR